MEMAALVVAAEAVQTVAVQELQPEQSVSVLELVSVTFAVSGRLIPDSFGLRYR